jgi:hypothetical protein
MPKRKFNFFDNQFYFEKIVKNESYQPDPTILEIKAIIPEKSK